MKAEKNNTAAERKTTEELKAPWKKYYTEKQPAHLDYPDSSLFSIVEKTAEKYPSLTAWEFMGSKATYAEFTAQIRQCARAFVAIGIKERERVTVCLPNVPAGIIAFYALNLIGAVPSMIHPLSPANDIKHYIEISESVAAITMDMFYEKFSEIYAQTDLRTLILTRIPDALSLPMGFLFNITRGRKIKPVPANADVIFWKDFMQKGLVYEGNPEVRKEGSDPAVILYSGGTSGKTKGILLSNRNFNALALQMGTAAGDVRPGDVMLSILPIFHGFGLGCCIHTAFAFALKAVLIPQFSAATYGKVVLQNKPNYIAGVPTLFEAMLVNPRFKNADLSFLKGIFCGGDSLSAGLKQKVDAFLKAHNCAEQIREGYGLTECVTGSCVCPRTVSKPGAIGIPLSDMYYKIVEPGTTNEVPYGADGEICICGPTVMMGYINHQEENRLTLQEHADGHTWLHTGDAGSMDSDGFVYFKQRLKRMIVTSGYSVYPSQLESVIDSHEAVLCSCVIGVSDLYKIQKIKAFIVLRPEWKTAEVIKKVQTDIEEYCKKNIPRYSQPYEYEYCDDLPRTLVGKIAYTVLEKREAEKAAEKQN